MSWLDYFLMILMAGIIALEMFRGFGRSVFDALLLYAALFAANALSLPLATHVHFHSGAAVNHSYAYVLLIVVFGVLALALSRFVYNMTLINTGMFEWLLGIGCGIAAGMMIAHCIVHTMDMADPDQTGNGRLVANGPVTHEMLDFDTYHSVLETMTGIQSYRRSLPDVSGH
jgi:uncharacterized membrane protein required for colicin V production